MMARDPSKYWTEREAAVEAGLAQSTANLAFRRLAATGLLEIRRAGRSHMVRLRGEYEIVDRIVDLLRLEQATLERGLQEAAGKVPKGTAVNLFGSTAREQNKSTSDIDVFVAAPDSDSAETAATLIRSTIRKALPARVQVIAIDRRASRQHRSTPLLDNIRREGLRLTTTTMAEVFG